MTTPRCLALSTNSLLLSVYSLRLRIQENYAFVQVRENLPTAMLIGSAGLFHGVPTGNVGETTSAWSVGWLTPPTSKSPPAWKIF